MGWLRLVLLALALAMTDVAAAYERAYGVPVASQFAASGLLRERIEGGERPDLSASANLAHPEALMAKGLGRAGGAARPQPAVRARPPGPRGDEREPARGDA